MPEQNPDPFHDQPAHLDHEPPGCLDHEVEGAINFREVILVGGSARLRPGQLYRAGHTHRISARSLERLATARGLRSVLDLRAHEELARTGIAAFSSVGITHYHAPMEDPADRTPTARLARLDRFRAGTHDWSESYLRIAETCRPSLRLAFCLLAGDAETPIVVHCAAGRDRTGITVALLLHALGVDASAIADDYNRSGAHLLRHVDAFMPSVDPAAPPNPHRLTRDEMARVLDTDRASMLRFLEGLAAAHGSIDAYLVTIGVDDDARRRLRARFLPGP